jgi:hypothetical protein
MEESIRQHLRKTQRGRVNRGATRPADRVREKEGYLGYEDVGRWAREAARRVGPG